MSANPLRSKVASLVAVPPAAPPLSLFDIPGCQFSRCGLEIKRGLSFEHYERLGRILDTVDAAVQWWIGDWLRYGEHEYEDGKYTQAVDATGYKEQTLMNLVFVAKNVPISRRREKLSFAHHAEVAALSPSQQVRWLQKAEQEGWTVKELRKGLQIAKTVAGSKRERQDLRDHILFAVSTVQELKAKCPDHSFVRRHYDEWLSDLQFELTERGVIDDQEKLIEAHDQGYRTDEALQKATGISRATIVEILGGRLGWEKVREGGKTEMARGDRRWIWRKPGDALGSDAQIPRVGREDQED